MKTFLTILSWLCDMQDQLTLPHRQQLLIHTESCWDEKVLPVSQRLRDERDEHVHSQELSTAELTSRSGWVRIVHRVQTFAATIRKTAGFLPPVLRPRAESSTWNGHSPYRQPQSQTVYCYLKLTPSMGAFTVLDDCRVTVKAYVRDFSGHLFVRKPPVGGIFLAVCWTWESDTERSDHAGACGVSGGTMDVKSQARRVGGKGREDHQLHCSEAKHYTLALLVHWLALRRSSPMEGFSLVTQHPYQCVFWSVITQWSPHRFHMI